MHALDVELELVPVRLAAPDGDDAGLVELAAGRTLELGDLLATEAGRLVRVETILECPSGSAVAALVQVSSVESLSFNSSL